MHPKIQQPGRIRTDLTKQSLAHGFQWLQSRAREAYECRSCDRPVSPFETTCPHCGSANPAKITLTPVSIGCCLGLLGFIVWFCLT